MAIQTLNVNDQNALLVATQTYEQFYQFDIVAGAPSVGIYVDDGTNAGSEVRAEFRLTLGDTQVGATVVNGAFTALVATDSVVVGILDDGTNVTVRLLDDLGVQLASLTTPTQSRVFAYIESLASDANTVAHETSDFTATGLPAGFVAVGDTPIAKIDGIPGTRTSTTVVDGLTTVQIDTLAYNSFDLGGNLVVNPEVLGSPNTTGTFIAPPSHDYTQITEGEIVEVRVTAANITNVTITTAAFIEHTEAVDPADVVITPQTGSGILADPFIDITTTTTPGGYTPTDTNHAQVVVTSSESALTCQSIQRDLSEYVQAAACKMYAIFQTDDAAAFDLGLNTDIGTTLGDLTHHRTAVIYHPVTANRVDGPLDIAGERADAAWLSRMATQQEGQAQWDYQEVVGVTDPCLFGSVQDNLRTKGYNFVESFKRTTFTHIFAGRSVTDREIRLQWGSDYLEINSESDIAAFAFNTPLMAFDDETFASVEAILYIWMQVGLDRRIIVNTPERPSTITLPNPESFSATDRKSGIARIDNAFCWAINSAIDEWDIRGEIKL